MVDEMRRAVVSVFALFEDNVTEVAWEANGSFSKDHWRTGGNKLGSGK
jgi:hypothetical protein